MKTVRVYFDFNISILMASTGHIYKLALKSVNGTFHQLLPAFLTPFSSHFPHLIFNILA